MYQGKKIIFEKHPNFGFIKSPSVTLFDGLFHPQENGWCWVHQGLRNANRFFF